MYRMSECPKRHTSRHPTEIVAETASRIEPSARARGSTTTRTAVQKVHQWVTFCSATPFQTAIAKGLELPDSYFQGFVKDYTHKRDFLSAALNKAGFEVLPCAGTYFLMARTDRFRRKEEDDVAFCKRLLVDHGVAAIPTSAFHSAEHAHHVAGLARFAFCKTEAVLQAAAVKLSRLSTGR